MNASLQQIDIRTHLKDATLFREDAFINGKWVKAKSGATFSVNNPATGDIIANVTNLDSGDAELAIAAAEQALSSWRSKTAKDRAMVMRKWFDLIIANTEDLAILMTLEQGKPLVESRGEVAYGASFVEWFAEESKRVTGAIIESTW